jgi:hypothetical protein
LMETFYNYFMLSFSGIITHKCTIGKGKTIE